MAVYGGSNGGQHGCQGRQRWSISGDGNGERERLYKIVAQKVGMAHCTDGCWKAAWSSGKVALESGIVIWEGITGEWHGRRWRATWPSGKAALNAR